MPTIMSIAEVRKLGVDMPVQGVKGTVTAIAKRYSGAKKDGSSYSLQKITLQDQTGKITVLLDGRDPAEQAWLNSEVYITGKHGQKGWMGLKTKDDTFKDKTEFILKATTAAEIALADGRQPEDKLPDEGDDLPYGNAPAKPDDAGLSPGQVAIMAALIGQGVEPGVACAQALKVAPLPQPAASIQPPAKSSLTGSQELQATPPAAAGEKTTPLGQAKIAALQAATLYVVAFDAALWTTKVCEARHQGFVMPPEHFQALCSTMFIHLDRMGWKIPMPPKEWIDAAASSEQQQSDNDGGAS